MRLLDTTVAIDALRGRVEAVDLLGDLIERNDVATSEVVRFELLAGARAKELERLDSFFSSLAWLPVTKKVSRTAGALARRFRASHGGIDDADYLIAASAIVADAELLTTNVRHYPMFARLEPPY